MDADELEALIAEFDDIIFEKQDLPALIHFLENHEELLSANNPLNNQVWSVITAIADSSHWPAMLNLYHRSNPDNRFQVLSWMAEQRSPMLFAYLKQLAPQANLTEGNWVSLMRTIIGEEIQAGLFPEWYGLLEDTVMGNGVVQLIHAARMRGAYLSAPLPESYAQNLQALSRRLLLNHDDFYLSRNARPLLSELAALSTPEGFAAINEYFELPENSLGIKYWAAAELLMAGQPIPPDLASALAGENYYRIEIQELLEASGFSQLFPKKYASREKMSEAYVYNYDGKNFPDRLVFRGTHDAILRGSKGTFYAYEVFFEAEKVSFLGFAGPFSMNGKEITMEKNGIAYVLDKPFTKSGWKNELVDWLKRFETSMNEIEANWRERNE